MASLPVAASLSTTPWAQPPPGIESNFGPDAPDKADAVLIVSIVMMLTTTMFVTLRIILNYNHASRRLGWDDACCVIALVFVLGYNALMINIRSYARHSWDIPLSWLGEPWLKSTYSLAILTTPAHLFSKLSLLIFYLRIFSVHGTIRYTIFAAMAYAICLYLVTIPLSSYYCAPPPGQSWVIISSKCVSLAAMSLVQAPLNMALDLYLLLAPLPVVAKMHLAPQKKVGTLAVFFTGIFALVTSVLAMYYRIILYSNRQNDSIWNYFNIVISAGVESEVALICSSMPAFASFSQSYIPYSRYFFAVRSRTWRRSNTNDRSESESRTKRAYPSVVTPARNTWQHDLESSSSTRLHDNTYFDLMKAPSTHETIPESTNEVPRQDPEKGLFPKTEQQQQPPD